MPYEITDKDRIRIDSIQDGDKKPTHDYGLCNRCRNLMIRKTRLMDEWVCCTAWLGYTKTTRPLMPSKSDPIEYCDSFEEKGQMTLEQMASIAIIIDVNEKKVGKIGFSTDVENDKKLIIVEDKEEDRG